MSNDLSEFNTVDFKMTSRKRNSSTVTSCTALHMEWDRISCPICMEQPHNAVLLICSSYKNGCRCYICNTSHRHSNCLDRFRKMNGDSKVRASNSTSSVLSNSDNRTIQPRAHYSMISRHLRSRRLREWIDNHVSHSYDASSGRNPAGLSRTENGNNNHQESGNSTVSMGGGSIVMEECCDIIGSSIGLKCPLCRGTVSGWIPAEELRQYLDQKLRSCSHDSCKFLGTYEQLREHARSAHMLVRPAHVDHSRKRAWDRLQQEQEHGDVISAIRSQMPGAIIVGDYVIETGDAVSPAEDTGEGSSNDWWSPNQDAAQSPDNRHVTCRFWPNERQGSPSNWPDGRHGSPRLLPQYRQDSQRRWFNDRHSSSTVWQNFRRSRNHSLWHRSFSYRHPRDQSEYRRGLSDRPYAVGDHMSPERSLDDPTVLPRRRQQLRYTNRGHYNP